MTKQFDFYISLYPRIFKSNQETMGLLSFLFGGSSKKISANSFVHTFNLNAKDVEYYSDEIVTDASVRIWANRHDKPQIRIYLKGYHANDGMISIHRMESVYNWLIENKSKYSYDFLIKSVSSNKIEVALRRELIPPKPKQSLEELVQTSIKKFNGKSRYRDYSVGYIAIKTPHPLKKRPDNKHVELEFYKEVSEQELYDYFVYHHTEDSYNEAYEKEFWNSHFRVMYKGEVAGKISMIHHSTLIKLLRCFRDYELKKFYISDSDKGDWDEETDRYSPSKLLRYEDGYRIYFHAEFE